MATYKGFHSNYLPGGVTRPFFTIPFSMGDSGFSGVYLSNISKLDLTSIQGSLVVYSSTSI